jgi:hypothetical protein
MIETSTRRSPHNLSIRLIVGDAFGHDILVFVGTVAPTNLVELGLGRLHRTSAIPNIAGNLVCVDEYHMITGILGHNYSSCVVGPKNETT